MGSPVAAAAGEPGPPPTKGALLPRPLAALAQGGTQAAPADHASAAGTQQYAGRRVMVELRFHHGAAVEAEAVREAGAQIVLVSDRYQTITAAILPSALPALSQIEGLAAVIPVVAPTAHAACPGAAVSEGDHVLQADLARSSLALDGSGVTVGIVSNSFDRDTAARTHLAQDVLSGDLPGPGNPCGNATPVSLLNDSVPDDDEGRAMGEIVHDLAPGAKIAFATGSEGELVFAKAIERLAAPVSQGGAGAKVIVDDLGYAQEPFFQDGPVADAIRAVVAEGVDYFTAAGNENEIVGGVDVSSWEAPAFRDSGSCPGELDSADYLSGLNTRHCLDFDPTSRVDDSDRFIVPGGRKLNVDLQWAEPWFGIGTDLDAYLLEEDGQVAQSCGEEADEPCYSVETNAETGTPYERLEYHNEADASEPVFLVINRFSGGTPRLKFVLEDGTSVEAVGYPTSEDGDVIGPTLVGHANSTAGASVAAAPAAKSSTPEEYSSRGPGVHYFGPVSGTTPAPPLAAPEAIVPDFTATDCVLNTFFEHEPGEFRFCGTSAAAPHAAAIAALMLQANPSLSFTQVRAAFAATATPMGGFDATAVGAGLVNALAAVKSVALPPVVSISAAPRSYSNEAEPTISFAANRPATFSCATAGVAAMPCSSPFHWPTPISDGSRSITVTATDAAGHSGSASASFVVDTKAPQTSFKKRPKKVVRTRRSKIRLSFRFRSDEPKVSFRCRIDRGEYRTCGARLRHRFRRGGHTVKVQAVDLAGNVDPSPAVFHFRVERPARHRPARAHRTRGK